MAEGYFAMIYIPTSFQQSFTLIPMKRVSPGCDPTSPEWIPCNPGCKAALEIFQRHAPYRQLIECRVPSQDNPRFGKCKRLYQQSGITKEEWNLLSTWHSFADRDEEDGIPHSMLDCYQGLLRRYEGWPPRSVDMTRESRLQVLTPWVEPHLRSLFEKDNSLPDKLNLVGWVIFEEVYQHELCSVNTHPFTLQVWATDQQEISQVIPWIQNIVPSRDDFIFTFAPNHQNYGYLFFRQKEHALSVFEKAQLPDSPILCPRSCVFFS